MKIEVITIPKNEQLHGSRAWTTVVVYQKTSKPFRQTPDSIGLRIETNKRIAVLSISAEEFGILKGQAQELGWGV